jgi:hypothetical protein
MPSSGWSLDTYVAAAESKELGMVFCRLPVHLLVLMHSLKLYEMVDTAIGKIQSDHGDHRHPGRKHTALG